MPIAQPMMAPEEEVAWTAEMSCIHHFRIPPAAGPTTIGTCHKCGAVREFLNAVDDHKPRVHKRARMRPYDVTSLAYAAAGWHVEGE